MADLDVEVWEFGVVFEHRAERPLVVKRFLKNAESPLEWASESQQTLSLDCFKY